MNTISCCDNLFISAPLLQLINIALHKFSYYSMRIQTACRSPQYLGVMCTLIIQAACGKSRLLLPLLQYPNQISHNQDEH